MTLSLGFLIAGVIKASLNVGGKYPLDMEWLNSSVRNGTISSVHSFITETGSRSAVKLLSGRQDIVEVMSLTVTEVKDISGVPGGTWENTGNLRSISTPSDGADFLREKLDEFVNIHARTR